MKSWLFSGRSHLGLGGLVLALSALAACGTDPNSSGSPIPTGAGGAAGGSTSGNGGQGGQPGPNCDTSIAVSSDSRALVVTDPEVLSRFGLERVLGKLLEDPAGPDKTPLRLLQELFDTENTTAGAVFPGQYHCNDLANPALMFTQGLANCPRAEGALAADNTLLTPGNPNAFVPVAIVNRFDLMNQSAATCGEYRIVYAKESGKANPDDRIFLIFEGALQNPTMGDVMGCLPVARFWAELGQEADVEVVGDKLDEFFFTGLPGLSPVVHHNNYGALSAPGDEYSDSKGQVRLGQKMQVPWEWREFRFLQGTFVPSTTKNNLIPERFDKAATPSDDWFRQGFVSNNMQSLSASELHQIRMSSPGKSTSGQSAFEGSAAVNYFERASGNPGADFATDVQTAINATGLGDACPPGDPLTAESLLHRATMQTCAGCHAPQQFLSASKSIGCGLTWPDSLGEVHISEAGELSPALKEVFLPRRADVLTTYAQACDLSAIFEKLEPGAGGGGPSIPPQ